MGEPLHVGCGSMLLKKARRQAGRPLPLVVRLADGCALAWRGSRSCEYCSANVESGIVLIGAGIDEEAEGVEFQRGTCARRAH